MLRKIIPRIITKNLITPSLTCFATPAKYSFDDLYNHNWLEYDPTHKVFKFRKCFFNNFR